MNPTCDPLLAEFWRASEGPSEREALERVMQRQVWPVAEWTCRRNLDRASAEDVEDALMRTVGSVLPAIVSAKRSDQVIENLGAYVRRAAQNACDELTRKRYPVRTRLASQVRYLFKHGSGFALWQHEGEWVGGFEAWHGQRPKIDPSTSSDVAERAFRGESAVAMTLPDAAARVLNHIGGPVSLSMLTSILQAARGEFDPRRADDESSPITEVAAGQEDAHASLEQREELAWLWQEVTELPVRQAQALLLNLRDARQKGVLDLLILENIVSMDDLADVLQLSPAALAEIWDELPWDDARIATFLEARPIDVSNLRSVAHRRLQRRLAKRCA